MLRKDVNPNDTWKLEDIFATDDDVVTQISELKQPIEEIKKF